MMNLKIGQEVIIHETTSPYSFIGKLIELDDKSAVVEFVKVKSPGWNSVLKPGEKITVMQRHIIDENSN